MRAMPFGRAGIGYSGPSRIDAVGLPLKKVSTNEMQAVAYRSHPQQYEFVKTLNLLIMSFIKTDSYDRVANYFNLVERAAAGCRGP